MEANKNIQIRVVQQKDIQDILEIYEPFVLKSAVSFEEEVPSLEKMWQRVALIVTELPFLVCEINKKVVAYVYASNHRQRGAYRWSKEVSVYVHPDFRKNKIASALYFCLFEILKIQGVITVLAGITLPHPSSVGFHEKLGFNKVAEYKAVGFKFGQWHNVGWWEMKLHPELFVPKEIITPFVDIQDGLFMKDIFEKGKEAILF